MVESGYETNCLIIGLSKQGLPAMSDAPGPSPAQTYEDFTVRYLLEPWTVPLFELAAPRPGEQVLDLACGTGVVARHVAPLVGAEGGVVAIDINPAMMEVARSLPASSGAPVEWKEGDAQALPLADDACDLVLCQQGLQFVPNRVAALRQVHRVLKPNGRLAFSVWCDLDFHPIYEALFGTINRRFPEAGAATAFRFGDVNELEQTLTECGFHEVQIHTHELLMRFPAAEQFLPQTLRAGAAVNPAAAAQMAPEVRQALMADIEQDVGPVIARHIVGGELRVPMRARLVLAHPKSAS
jgi:ubiquinone/menaquinone biosynthesis C-methylase UbiE